jgi:hypothetical protein
MQPQLDGSIANRRSAAYPCDPRHFLKTGGARAKAAALQRRGGRDRRHCVLGYRAGRGEDLLGSTQGLPEILHQNRGRSSRVPRQVRRNSSVVRFRMSRREPAWDELRTFLEVARDGNLSLVERCRK